MTKIFAHRGSKGTHPENTIVSFKEAIRVGSDGIEIDVHLSKDKELIVIHDEKLDRTTNGKGYIKDRTLEEIKRLDAGSWFSEDYKEEKVPVIQDVINLLNDLDYRGILNIEIKTDNFKYKGIEKRLAHVLRNQELKFTYLYSSFNIKSLEKMWLYDRKVAKVWLVKGISNKNKELARLEKNKLLDGINPNIKKIKGKEEFLNSFSKNIRAWTVNDVEDMKYCFSKNIEGIITDYPGKAIKIREDFENRK